MHYFNIASSGDAEPSKKDYKLINVGTNFSKIQILHKPQIFVATYPEINTVNFYAIEEIGCVWNITP